MDQNPEVPSSWDYPVTPQPEISPKLLLCQAECTHMGNAHTKGTNQPKEKQQIAAKDIDESSRRRRSLTPLDFHQQPRQSCRSSTGDTELGSITKGSGLGQNAFGTTGSGETRVKPFAGGRAAAPRAAGVKQEVPHRAQGGWAVAAAWISASTTKSGSSGAGPEGKSSEIDLPWGHAEWQQSDGERDPRWMQILGQGLPRCASIISIAEQAPIIHASSGK